MQNENQDQERHFRPIKAEKTTTAQIHEDHHHRKSKRKGEKKSRSHKNDKALDVNLTSSIGEQKELTKKDLLKCLDMIEKTKKGLLNKEVESKDSENDSTTVSVTFSSSKIKHSPKKQKKKQPKEAPKLHDKNRQQSSGDFFVEVIIDELKRENSELKTSLRTREDQLRTAAEKVKEMVEENARLARKLEKTLSRAHEHAENYGEEIHEKELKYKQKIERLKDKLDEAEDRNLMRKSDDIAEATEVIKMLKKKLNESEEQKKILQDYIDNLKESYAAAFGDKRESSLRSVQD